MACGFFSPGPTGKSPFITCFKSSSVSSVQSLSHVQLCATPGTAARQASLSFPNSQSFLKLVSIESVIPSNFSSCPQSFPASGSFQMSQFFTSGGQSIEVSASASVLPMNIQGWFPLGWTGLISLLSKGLSIVFSNTTVQKHQLLRSAFYMVQLSNLYMTTGKSITLTRWTFVGQVMSLLFNKSSLESVIYIQYNAPILSTVGWFWCPWAWVLECRHVLSPSLPL